MKIISTDSRTVALAAAVIISSLHGAPVWAADILDCAGALKAANPYNTGKVGMSGNGWFYKWEEPAILSSADAVKRDGWNGEVRSEVQPGDKLRAVIQLLGRGPQATKTAPQISYRLRWIAPRDIKWDGGKVSRCGDEIATTLDLNTQALHDLILSEADIQAGAGVWQFFGYDLKGNPQFLFSYDIQRTKTNQQKAADALAKHFMDYMRLGKCLAINLTPLPKSDYLQAITAIDKAAKAKGLDTNAIWQKTGEENKQALDTWDQHIAGYTGIGWEQRQGLRESCASTSASLMRAAKDASGSGSAPKKDF